jgi:lycopene cyclase domain-containing protein
MKFLYLLIDTLAIAVPLLFSFHPKIKFYLSWKSFFSANLLTAALFLGFDSIFTYLGVWSFNPRYITGIHIYNLPMEEILFFICIPYSCVFTYYCLDKFYDLSWNVKAENIFCILFSLILLLTGLAFRQKSYTCSTFISTALLCLVLKFAVHIKWFGKAVSVYGLLLLPFIIINGILTGTGLAQPVVQYNISENTGIRFLTIPIEDFIYGFELFLINLFLYMRFSKKLPFTRMDTDHKKPVSNASKMFH